MDPTSVLAQRLARQHLSSAPLPRAEDVVRLLTCVQSQERDHAFSSLALRSRAQTYAAVRREFDAGAFVRTHILRPTWHFVTPEDLRWILALTSPRVLPSMGARHRQLGLDDPRRLGDGLDLLADLLQDRTFMTRPAINQAFTDRRSPVLPGEQLGHLLLIAELRGMICSTTIQGVHHAYGLVDEVVPQAPDSPRTPRDRECAVRELVRRFFLGHGPASVKDFTRWSSLTVSDTTAALADLGDALARTEVEGTSLWHDPAAPPRRSPSAPAAFLFPTYDEAVLTYPSLNFPVLPGHPRGGVTDPFWAVVVAGGVNVGIWKRVVRAGTVEVQTRLAPGVGGGARRDIRIAAQRLADFLEGDLSYAETVGGSG